ncbi:unnamed protein product [Rhodiola kirilowii]
MEPFLTRQCGARYIQETAKQNHKGGGTKTSIASLCALFVCINFFCTWIP